MIEVVLSRLFLRAAIWHAEFDANTFPPNLEEQCGNMAEALLNLARHLDSCDDC